VQGPGSIESVQADAGDFFHFFHSDVAICTLALCCCLFGAGERNGTDRFVAITQFSAEPRQFGGPCIFLVGLRIT